MSHGETPMKLSIMYVERSHAPRVAVLLFPIFAWACGCSPANGPVIATEVAKEPPAAVAPVVLPKAAAACPTAPPDADAQARLDAIATCFHAAVLALNRQPKAGETLSDFFSAAAMSSATALTLADGAVVSFEITGQEHDDYEDGHSEYTTTYRFSAAGHPETAQTTIVLSMGGGL
jgi:hypothetical protein